MRLADSPGLTANVVKISAAGLHPGEHSKSRGWRAWRVGAHDMQLHRRRVSWRLPSLSIDRTCLPSEASETFSIWPACTRGAFGMGHNYLRLAELGLVGAHLDGVKEGRVGPRRRGGARRRRREGREAGRRGTKGTGELRPPPSVQRHRRNRARGVEVLRAQNGLRGEGISANERRNGENLVQHRCVGEGRRTRCVWACLLGPSRPFSVSSRHSWNYPTNLVQLT